MNSSKVSASKERRKSYESKFDLTSIFEFSNNINATHELKYILNHFLLTIMGKLLSFRGMILLEKSDEVFEVSIVKGLPSETGQTNLKIKQIPQRLLYVAAEDARKYPWIKLFREKDIAMVVPLKVREKIVGLAGFGMPRIRKRLNQKEETYVKSLANIAGAAIEKGIIIEELRQVNRRLDGKIQELNTLFEMSKEFNALLDSERLLKLLTFSLMGQIGVNRYFISLKRNGTMQTVLSKIDKEIPAGVQTYFLSLRAPTVVESITQKDLKQAKTALEGLGIKVLVPLQIHNEIKGMIGLGEKMRGGNYSQTDLEFLSSLGNLAIISLENARLFQEAIEKQKLEDELLIAKEIQRGLLPARLPNLPHFDLAATNISSKQVGGDYYDAIALDNHRFLLAIGDVSGKGTPASLLMANLQATIRALIPLDLSLSELTKRVNDLICENTGMDRFITFFWGILDTDRNVFRYVSAGHNPPYVFRIDGTLERLDKGGIILGVMKALVPYEEGEVKLSSGDVLLMFTDGVSEAMSNKGEEFGEERLEQIAKAHLHEPSDSLLHKLVTAVQDHAKNTIQSDDITLVIAKAV